MIALFAFGASAHAEPEPLASPLTLEDAVARALSRNERARTADEEVTAANARVGQARAFFFPDLTVVGTYTRRLRDTVRQVGGENVVIQSRNGLGAVGTLRMRLLDVRGFPLYAQAARSAEAQGYLSAEQKRALSFETATAFVQVLSLEQVSSAAAQRLEFARRNLQDAQARFEAKLVGRNDVTQARLELSTAEREVARSRGDLQTAFLQLGYLLDAEVKPPLAVPQQLVQAALAPPPEPGPLLAESVARRPDVAALRKQAAAAHAFAQEPMLRHLPSLGLTGQYRLTNETGLTGQVGDGFVAIDLTWSLLDGGSRYSESAERHAQARVADLDVQAGERKVALDVRSAITSMQAEQAALQQADDAAKAARENADETATLYREGLTAALQVSDANIRLFEAEVALAQARYGLALSFLDLRAALGLDALGKDTAR